MVLLLAGLDVLLSVSVGEVLLAEGAGEVAQGTVRGEYIDQEPSFNLNCNVCTYLTVPKGCIGSFNLPLKHAEERKN